MALPTVPRFVSNVRRPKIVRLRLRKFTFARNRKNHQFEAVRKFQDCTDQFRTGKQHASASSRATAEPFEFAQLNNSLHWPVLCLLPLVWEPVMDLRNRNHLLRAGGCIVQYLVAIGAALVAAYFIVQARW